MDWLWRWVVIQLAPFIPEVSPPDEVDEAPSGNEPTPQGIFRQEAARQLDSQVSTNDVLDTRNMNIVLVGSIVLPVTFGLLSIGDRETPPWAGRALGASLLFYALLLAASWWASKFRGLGYRPDLPDLYANVEEYSASLLEQWIAIEHMRSTIQNEERLKKKARWIGWANTLLYLEGVSLSIAAVLALL